MILTKKMVIVRGKGTRNEQRIITDVDLFWSPSLQQWVSIPVKERNAK